MRVTSLPPKLTYLHHGRTTSNPQTLPQSLCTLSLLTKIVNFAVQVSRPQETRGTKWQGDGIPEAAGSER